MILSSHFQLRYLAPAALALSTLANAQVEPVGDQTLTPPVSYAAMSQVNSMLVQLEQSSQTTQLDLAKLRIDRWRTESSNKRQTQSNVDSVSRNLHDALPAIIGEVRSAPESMLSTFKLYRNLDALYDVLGSVVESVGAFGSKDEFQTLANDLTALENSRKVFADRMETLAGSKEVELTRLRSQIRTAQAVAPVSQPKKVVVDDNEPPKKPAKKPAPKTPVKAVPKPPTATPNS